MPRKRSMPLLRMIVGSTLGIIGFATLSGGFMRLNGAQMLVGVLEILIATAMTLSLMVPLRAKPPTLPTDPDDG